ncbi:hypothetical protein ACX0G9_22575 [Flavitalea flava]
MRIFYANENYSKYSFRGMNYFMALIMATFYVIITLLMVLFIFTAVYPKFYEYYLSVDPRMPSLLSSILTLGFIFFVLRITIKEDALKEYTITKEFVHKAVNYLIAYALVVGLIIMFVGLKFLRHYKGHL